jgi:hypothetical protein
MNRRRNSTYCFCQQFTFALAHYAAAILNLVPQLDFTIRPWLIRGGTLCATSTPEIDT